jgi:hypothetical protein
MSIAAPRVHRLPPTLGDRCRFRLHPMTRIFVANPFDSGPAYTCQCGASFYPKHRVLVPPLWRRWGAA